eukprot:3961142-Amphidinium_carterae.1
MRPGMRHAPCIVARFQFCHASPNQVLDTNSWYLFLQHQVTETSPRPPDLGKMHWLVSSLLYNLRIAQTVMLPWAAVQTLHDLRDPFCTDTDSRDPLPSAILV